MCELWITNCWSAGLKEERGAWPPATRKSDSLQYGYGAVSVSPQRQRASKELGFSREKNIYKQLAQLATARGATEANISRMLLFLTFAVCSLHKCKTHYGN
jgi:hypothetical protein